MRTLRLVFDQTEIGGDPEGFAFEGDVQNDIFEHPFPEENRRDGDTVLFTNPLFEAIQ